MQKERKGRALWDHQHQGESCKSFPTNIFLGMCNAGTTPRDKSLLRESFWIPDEVSVTATRVTTAHCNGRAVPALSGARGKQANSRGWEAKQQGLCKGNSTRGTPRHCRLSAPCLSPLQAHQHLPLRGTTLLLKHCSER